MARLIWHRRDLRIHDNELYQAGKQTIYSLFIFDPSDYSPRSSGIDDGSGNKLLNVIHGPHYTRRLLLAVLSLRRKLQSLGGNLIVRQGDPLQIVPQLAKDLNAEEVAWSEIPGYYEYVQSEKLKHELLRDRAYRCEVFTTSSITLFDPDVLPKNQNTWQRLARPKEKRKKRQSTKPNSDTTDTLTRTELNATELCSSMVDPLRFFGMPTIMGYFRRAARTSAPIRDLFDEPHFQFIAKEFSDLDMGDIPTLEELSQPLLQSNTPILGCLPKDLIQQLVQSATELTKQDGCITS